MPIIDSAITQVRAMAAQLGAMLPKLVLGVITFGIVLIVAKVLGRVMLRVTKRLRKHRSLAVLLSRLVQTVVVLLGGLLGAAIVFPSFKIGSIVEILGIGSVAVGFAFRDILQNFLAGILLLWTEPFRIGDQITYAPFEGTVEDIQTRATFVRTYDGRRIVIPNAELFTHAVTVNTAFDKRRVEYDVGIGVNDSVTLAKQVVLDALETIPEVLRSPAPDVLVVELGDFSVKLRIRWWIAPPTWSDLLDARDSVLSVVKRDLTRNGIELPFPTTTTQVVLGEQQT